MENTNFELKPYTNAFTFNFYKELWFKIKCDYIFQQTLE